MAAGSISTAAKQILTDNEQLEVAALRDSQFGFDAGLFFHTGLGIFYPGDRIVAEGFDWTGLGGKIALVVSTNAVPPKSYIA